MLSDDARWQYYIASYVMSEPTEGVDLSRMTSPFLKRNVARQKENVAEAYKKVYGSLQHMDDHTAHIGPEKYQMKIKGTFVQERRTAEVIRDNKRANANFDERFVKHPAWLREESEEDIGRRKAAWEKALEEGLSTYEENLHAGTTQELAMAEATG